MYTVRKGVLLLATRDGSGELLFRVSGRLIPPALVYIEYHPQQKNKIPEYHLSSGVSVRQREAASSLWGPQQTPAIEKAACSALLPTLKQPFSLPLYAVAPSFLSAARKYLLRFLVFLPFSSFQVGGLWFSQK